MVICHSCWRRPRWIGVDIAVTVPEEMARRKSVLLLTPTTFPPPLSASQTAADTLARLSTIEALERFFVERRVTFYDDNAPGARLHLEAA